MRKALALVLALIMVLSMNLSLADEIDWSAKEKLQINWTTYFVSPPSEDALTIKHIEEKFNVDINMLPIEDSNFLEVLNTYIMGGDTPDVIRLKDPSKFNTYVDQGALGAINMDILREYAPAICASIDAYSDGSFWAYGNVDGVQYGIPAISSGNLYHLPVVYNETWMKNVGVEKAPETLDEFYDLMVKFAKNDPDGNGVDDTYGLSSDGLRVLWGAYGVNPGACDGRNDHSYFQLIDGKVTYAATSEQYKEALKTAAQWYKEGLIDPEFITGENTGGYWAISHSLINHRVGMTVRANYYHWVMEGDYMICDAEGNEIPVAAGAVAKEFALANPDEDIMMGPTVKGPYGEGVKSWTMLAQFYCFSERACENEEMFTRICAIMEYMDRQYSRDPEIKQAWYEDIYGEEGKYWYWSDKSALEVTLTEEYNTKYPMETPVDEFGPTQWGPNLPNPPSGRGPQYAASLGYDHNGIVNLIQFSLPLMADYQNNLTSLKDLWMIDFIIGQKDVDADWDAYIAEMNASGLQEMIDEATEWYWNSVK